VAAEHTAQHTAAPSRLPRTLARRVGQGVPAALTRYRVMAWVVGVLLIALVLVAVPLKHFGGVDGPVAVIGTAHGWLYAIFFVTACDLALRARWSLKGTVLVLVAGTVPILSFLAERIATRRTRAGERV
jgi:integral membrane protein